MSAAQPLPQRWPRWRGKTVVCLATGPSVTAQQVQQSFFAHYRGTARVIAVNDMGLRERRDDLGAEVPTAPWADVWYAADDAFWRRNAAQARVSEALRIGGEMDSERDGLTHLYLRSYLIAEECPGWHVPGHAVNGGHSGFQALQIALAAGAARVLLVGYDCRRYRRGTNYFGHKPPELRPPLRAASPYESWPIEYDHLPLPSGVEVLNCTPGSAITAYPTAELARALACD